MSTTFRCLLVTLILLISAGESAFADRITLPKPVRTVVYTNDKTALAGRVTDYDLTSFTLIDGKGESRDVAWSDLEPHSMFQLRAMLIGSKSADPWIELGKELLTRGEAGQPWAQHAFDRAIGIDPTCQDQIDAAKKDAAAAGQPAGNAAAGSTSTPWPPLSADEQAAAVTQLKEIGKKSIETSNDHLTLSETTYFLFYTDLSAQDANKWAALLDRMYARVSQTFGVKLGDNIWRGKALIFVFRNQDEYRGFETAVYKHDAGDSVATIHNETNGDVHITCYQEAQELQFAHLLVHEAVRGFIHRYHTPAPLPSWVITGLAEAIASDIVKDPTRPNSIMWAREELRDHGNTLGDFFTTQNLPGWQYPVAEAMCQFMLKESKPNYVAFIDGIKQGLSVEDSLNQKYQAPKERLVAGFAQYLAIQNLKE